MMYVVRDREAGNVITQFETMEEAQKELERYEEQDKKDLEKRKNDKGKR